MIHPSDVCIEENKIPVLEVRLRRAIQKTAVAILTLLIGLFLIVFGVCYFKYHNDQTNEMRQEYTCDLTNRLITPRCGNIDRLGAVGGSTVAIVGAGGSKSQNVIYTILENCHADGQPLVGTAALSIRGSEYDYFVNNNVTGITRQYFYSPAYDPGGLLCQDQVVPIFYVDQNSFNSDPVNWIIYLVFVIFGSIIATVGLSFTVAFSVYVDGYRNDLIQYKLTLSAQQSRQNNV